MYSAVENVNDFKILYGVSVGNDAIGHWLCVYYRSETMKFDWMCYGRKIIFTENPNYFSV